MPTLSPDQEAALSRMRKILSKINHEGGATQATEGEMDTAMKMARRLMDKFNIDEGLFQTLVEGSQAQKDSLFDSIVREHGFSRKDFNGTEFFVRLAHAVENVTDARMERQQRQQKNPQARTNSFGQVETESFRDCIDFYGLPRDVAVAKALYQELIATMHAMARVSYGKGWTYKHSAYAFGLSDRLLARSELIREAHAAPSDSTGTVYSPENGHPTPDTHAQAGAIVVHKGALLDRYKYDVLKYPRPLSQERQMELTAEADAAYEVRLARHKLRYATDPGYRRACDAEARRQANRRGPRQRTVDGAAYNRGQSDAENVSLGTNQVGVTRKEVR